jgi:transcriptional regulator with XRE-family HTH domain/Zn-dependent peptidase ImmA (M78 family)
MIGERVKAARRLAGLSQQQLGEAIGVTNMAISKYERGQVVPDGVRLAQLAEALDTEVGVLLRTDATVRLSPASFRWHPMKRRSKREEQAVEARARLWLERYLVLEELLNQRDETPLLEALREHVGVGSDPENAAAAVRKYWNLGRDPIESMVDVLEDNGVKVLAVDRAGSANASSFEVSGTQPAVLVGRLLPDSERCCPGDRERFSLAHELGHFIADASLEPKARESFSDRFAAAFIVPKEAAVRELGRQRSAVPVSELGFLKEKYGLSMQAWIRRAKELGILSPSNAKAMLAQAKASGWEQEEPVEVRFEEPRRMLRLALRAWAEGLITESRASELSGCSREDLRVMRSHVRETVGVGACA